MEILEKSADWKADFDKWRNSRGNSRTSDDIGGEYPFVTNKRAPFQPARSALSMLNLAVISSAGAYIDGTDPFDTNAVDGDVTFREIPREVEASDLLFAGRGYDTTSIKADMNSQIPIERLSEFQSNGIIGQLNPVWWSFSGFIPNAGMLVEKLIPELVGRLKRYEVRLALLIPASRLCHQSVALVARALELEQIPTMMIAVDRKIPELVRPPRAGYYKGEFGSVAGKPGFPEHQRRVLDQALRWIEPLDQPTVGQLVVDLETAVETERGER